MSVVSPPGVARFGVVLIPLLVILLTVVIGCSRQDASSHRVEAAILDLTARNNVPYVETFALEHTFDILGLPYIVTDDIKEAAGYKVIYTGGMLNNPTLTPEESDLLYDFVDSGGVLVSAVILGNRYSPLFGIGATVSKKDRFTVNFDDPEKDRALKYLDREEEKKIQLGNRSFFEEIIWSHGFDPKDATPLAAMEDGSTVLSVNYYGQGTAYAFGLAYADVILTPQVGKDFEAQRDFINVFEPGADVFMLTLKAIYEETISPYVYLSTIPYGQETAFIITHDVDAQTSFKNSLEYARMESKYGIKSTFFVTTKYFIDDTDIGYYEPTNIEYIRQVKEMGFDIGSHTVAHSKVFSTFPIGDLEVSRETYDPRISPSVIGEVKVSKDILDKDFNQETIAFRAGDLEYPDSLIESLEKAGYLYDATFSANDILTNFAYRALKRRNLNAPESKVVEVPVIFDDSQGLLTEENWEEMVPIWLDIIWANRDNEAISTLLIHPAIASYRVQAEEEVIKALIDKDVWIGDLTSYGDFWNERAEVKYKTTLKDGLLGIHLESNDISPTVSFVVEDSAKVEEIKVLNKRGREIEYQEIKRDGKIFLRGEK